MHIVYDEFSNDFRLKTLKNKKIKLFHEAILEYLKNIEIELMQILKEQEFLDAIVKKDIEWAYMYDEDTIYYGITYIFFEDIEYMNGSERENDFSILIAIKEFDTICIGNYELTFECEDLISKEFNSIKEFQDSLPFFMDKPKKVLNQYIVESYENRRKVIKHNKYLQNLINIIDIDVIDFLDKNKLMNHLLKKVLDYNLNYNEEKKEFLYCVTYAFNEPLRLQQSYTGNDSVYKSYTLYDDNYDVNQHTYSFQVKVIRKKIYYRIIPSKNKSYQLVSETLNDNAKSTLKKKSKKFIDIIKNGLGQS